jgi:hypothetical protein
MARQDRTLLQSLASLLSPQTIPMLISQGVPRKLLPVGTLLLGLILGFLWAYLISPTVYTSAEYVNLGESWKRDLIKQVAWQYQATGDAQIVTQQLSTLGNADVLIAQLLQTETEPNTLNALSQIAPFANRDEAQLAKVTPGALNNNFTPILCIIAAAIILGLPVIVNAIIPFRYLFERKADASLSTVQQGVEGKRREELEKAKKIAESAPLPAAVVDRGTPVAKFLPTYILGDDLFDESYSIETPTGEFLGETGAGISKTIGVGAPKKVTAVEVWVFDKNDIRTVTKVLMSQHAYNDDAIRAELAPKGEAVAVGPGTVVLLETQTLTIQARVIDFAYGTGSLPENSFFERFSVEIAAFPKKADSGGSDAFGDTSPVNRA